MAETLLNGGRGDNYEWGQTLVEVTVHMPLHGMRARDLSVELQRQRVRVAPKKGGDTMLEGTLAQPVRCDESTWMVEDGVLVIQLAKDNMRAENTGPSKEWWFGLFAGEDTIDSAAVSVGDYAKSSHLRPEQRTELEEMQSRRMEAEAGQDKAAATEAALDPSRREALEKLRAQFPDIPIEWGDTQSSDGGR